jgi:hypothetical protein
MSLNTLPNTIDQIGQALPPIPSSRNLPIPGQTHNAPRSPLTRLYHRGLDKTKPVPGKTRRQERV